jgi:hypothetical protein
MRLDKPSGWKKTAHPTTPDIFSRNDFVATGFNSQLNALPCFTLQWREFSRTLLLCDFCL